jgi:hypothetical protein
MGIRANEERLILETKQLKTFEGLTENWTDLGLTSGMLDLDSNDISAVVMELEKNEDKATWLEEINDSNTGIGITDITSDSSATTAINVMKSNKDKADWLDDINAADSAIGITAITTNLTATNAVTALTTNKTKADAFDTVDAAAVAAGLSAGTPAVDATAMAAIFGDLSAHCSGGANQTTAAAVSPNGYESCLSACNLGLHFTGWTDQDGGAPGFQCS